jgi:two-component system chemotaxis sensor kinase CheA
MIEDEGFRSLFRQESAEYLQQLDDGLLGLERRPSDDAAVDALFRAAHSLKGAAHMLGLDAVEVLAHSLEDMLATARRDVEARSSEHVREMLRQLADIRVALAEALAPDGPPAAAGAAAVLAAEAGRAGAGAGAPAVLDSVRVPSARLDTLLVLGGELAVARTSIARRLADLDELADQCEALRRAVARDLGVDPARTLALLERLAPIDATLARLRAALGADCARLDLVSAELNDGVRAIRLVPLANIFRPFPRMVQELAHAQGKWVDLAIEGEAVGADKRILEEIRDPLMHLLRNAVDHGIETPDERAGAGKPARGLIRLSARRTGSVLELTVSDDGRGLDEEAIRSAARQAGAEGEAALAAMSGAQLHALIFRPGLTTARRVSDLSGRGIGLDVMRECIERLKGSFALDSAPGRGLGLTLRFPVTLVTARILIVEAGRCPYGLPVEHVLAARRLSGDEVLRLEGRDAMLFEGQPIPLAPLGELLEHPAPERDANGTGRRVVVVLATVTARFGVLVDALLDEQEVVVKPPGALLERVRNVAGATILDDGEICVILSAQDLESSIRRPPAGAGSKAADAAPVRRKRILLAEDSIVTRTQETRILAAAGYEVVAAVDGLDALQKLARGAFDAVVTDVDMPGLDGIGLARRIRSEARHAHLPIVLVTSLASDADRKRGLEAGANAYITKPGFDQRELIECLERLI